MPPLKEAFIFYRRFVDLLSVLSAEVERLRYFFRYKIQ